MTAAAVLPLDALRMRQALDAAALAIGLSDPNPRVGCVIGRDDGSVLAVGHTQRVGEAHAEVHALRAAAALGVDVRGATVWVTLEPCSHQGRTPPCCEALIAAGVRRVVVAMRDPFPAVDGRGLAHLASAGIDVHVLAGPLADEARELNIGFVSRCERGRPWVRSKVAMSLDGRVALANGESQWITSAEARADGHQWRRRAGAILTGIGTLLRDDPRLTVREAATDRQPLRVVLDSHWRTPLAARVLSEPGTCLIAGMEGDPGPGAAERRWALAARAQTQAVAHDAAGLKLASVIDEFTRREVNEVHVEAGSRLNGSLLRDAWIDEWLVYLAPCWLGPGLDAVALPALSRLDQRFALRVVDCTQVGQDLRLRLRQAVSLPAASDVARLDS